MRDSSRDAPNEPQGPTCPPSQILAKMPHKHLKVVHRRRAHRGYTQCARHRDPRHRRLIMFLSYVTWKSVRIALRHVMLGSYLCSGRDKSRGSSGRNTDSSKSVYKAVPAMAKRAHHLQRTWSHRRRPELQPARRQHLCSIHQEARLHMARRSYTTARHARSVPHLAWDDVHPSSAIPCKLPASWQTAHVLRSEGPKLIVHNAGSTSVKTSVAQYPAARPNQPTAATPVVARASTHTRPNHDSRLMPANFSSPAQTSCSYGVGRKCWRPC